MDIFKWLKEAQELARQGRHHPAFGSLDFDSEFRAAVSFDLRHAQDDTGRELSRAEVAAKMTDFTGSEITVSMLNNWSAESHERHRFPAQYLPAFVLASGSRRVFEVISRKAGLYALPGAEALRAEIQKDFEEIKNRKKAIQHKTVLLKEIDK